MSFERRNGTAFDRILSDARRVSGRAIDRLRGLRDDLPTGVVEQLERLRDDPAQERRKAVRVGDGGLAVAVAAPGLADPSRAPAVKDHCASGLAILLPCPAGVGTILRVRIPQVLGGGGWVAAEVRYCRREGDAWVAGCELLGY